LFKRISSFEDKIKRKIKEIKENEDTKGRNYEPTSMQSLRSASGAGVEWVVNGRHWTLGINVQEKKEP
jgi:hypothetical protein